MNKNKYVLSLSVLLSFSTLSAEAALSSNALLAFDAGVLGGAYNTEIISGSYFAVDTGGDGVLDVYDRVAISPGTDGGLLVGQTQLAANSHAGSPDGTEISPFDAPWTFLGNTGMHQSTLPVNILSDDGSGNVLLDFSGWGAIWNGVNEINLGGDTNYSETGVATVACGFDCSYGDSFALNYAVHVPDGAFMGVYWGLHLEGTVSAVPIPAAVWLFGSGFVALLGIASRRKRF